MDLSKYIRKSEQRASKKNPNTPILKCRQCGNDLTKEDLFLYYQRFCSGKCRTKYLHS